MATIAKNRVHLKTAPEGSGRVSEFYTVTMPTPSQRRAFDLLNHK